MSYGNRDYPQRPRFREVPPSERQYPPQQYDDQPQQYQPRDRQPASGSNSNSNGGGDFRRAGYMRLSRSGNAITFTLQGQRYTVAVSSLEKVLRQESEYCVISRYSNGNQVGMSND